MMTHLKVSWQPNLSGNLIYLRPLAEDDFEPLFQAASDPLIWEQHPEPDRYRRDKFSNYFRNGIESNGALTIIDQQTGMIIGSSRFTNYDPKNSSVEVGYTFLARSHWGKGHNRELKLLMLNYAFQFVETIFFFVGDTNHRSKKAMRGIGATEVGRTPSKVGSYVAFIFQMTKTNWDRRSL
jgi:RimJ/RimL family protein N-acetyltransferase